MYIIKNIYFPRFYVYYQKYICALNYYIIYIGSVLFRKMKNSENEQFGKVTITKLMTPLYLIFLKYYK